MPYYALNSQVPLFPHPLLAGGQGLLAVGGHLDREWLLSAYSHGIFPWYSENEPILWWFPDPRAVLWPEDLHVSRSLRSAMRNSGWSVTANRDFEKVIEACAYINRPGQEGTWITEEMKGAYTDFHQAGYAHSVEVWDHAGNLVGGLYGIVLGRIFFGESMFSRVSNASKVALVKWVDVLRNAGIKCIDCQQDTPHMRSMGAVTIPAAEFYYLIQENRNEILRSDIFRVSGVI